jgi:predicted AAA+ superfamily ATPase
MNKMPHFRKRHLEKPFSELIRHSRIVGVLGHRQVGKTTFIQANSNEYLTLDEKHELQSARLDPKAFLARLKGKKSAIDECQLAPELFPALKVRVGTSQTPGQFILSGSVRFTSREAIRESLTGRISNLEALPLVLSELAQDENSTFMPKLIQAASLQSFVSSLTIPVSLHRERVKLIEKYASYGGLPGICFVRSLQTRKNLLKDLIETILDRDVRLVYPTTLPYTSIFDLCRKIATQPGEPLNHSEIQREIGMSTSTQKKIIRALESVFLLRRIPIEGDFRGDLFWFEDQIERSLFTRDDSPTEWDWTGLVYRNLRAQFGYRVGHFANYSHFRTRGGAMVPLVIQSENRKIGIFALNSASDVNQSRIRSSESFLKQHESARVLFLIKDEPKISLLGERMAIVPMSCALFN